MKAYIVIENCADYEQILCLKTGEGLPKDGILVWADDGTDRTAFASRKEAREAINRTHYYSKAFNDPSLPERQDCRVVPIICPDNGR